MKLFCSLYVGVDELHQRDTSDWDLRKPEREGERTAVAQRGETEKAACSELEIELSGC